MARRLFPVASGALALALAFHTRAQDVPRMAANAKRAAPQTSWAALPALTVATPPPRARMHQVFVLPGQTLKGLARQNCTSPRTLARLNKLVPSASLTPGQGVWVPDSVRPQASCRVRALQTPVRFERAGTPERVHVRLLTDKGTASPVAIKRLAPLLRPRLGGAGRAPHPRLVELLARVAKRFGGRPVEVVSGYRRAGGYTSRHSRHTLGRAIDLRIPGVKNTQLRDYCRSLANTGVGYYPKSSFVHLDVRDSSAYWVDVSRPGERPRYLGERVRRPEEPPANATDQPTEPVRDVEAEEDSDIADGTLG